MNKIFTVLGAFLLIGSVYAYDFGVSATFTQEEAISDFSAEVALGQSETFNVLVGALFDFEPLTIDASVGARYQVWSPEGGDLYAVGRVAVPVFADGGAVLGTPVGYAGLMLIPEAESGGSVSFEAGVRTQLDEETFSDYPQFYARVGLMF